MSKENSSLRWNLLLVRICVKILEMIEDLNYYINLVDKAMERSERMGSYFKRSSVGKMLPNNIACCREMFHERENQSVWQTSLSYFRKLSQPTVSNPFMKRKFNQFCNLHFCLILRNFHSTAALQVPSAWSVGCNQHWDPPPRGLPLAEGWDYG